ncbi:MAG TPA: glucose-6-phosphate dehydrogenase [Candidatus Dormibacteraeota bacterium]|nr:glucose-6-phosphate dehydrogenase [Candidatus Dormibacteraeota bacterium]
MSDRRAPTDLVIFGASGDLARRKIIPALHSLDGNMGGLRVLGAGRSDISRAGFQEIVTEASGSAALGAEADWVRLDYDSPASYSDLKERLGHGRGVVFYLATPPQTFGSILGALSEAGLASRDNANQRIVVEKPLGQDAPSARRLNQQLRELFSEDQVFRIDHYLAKDTVQNVLAFRFSNSIFEPVWNRTMVQSIEITAAEEIGIVNRAGYYDRIGAVRDMVQNHVLQVLALVTMEPPTTFDPADIRKAKLELLRAVEPLDHNAAVRGQYEGYLDENGVDPDSRRETFAAARVSIENWRWDGVPIFIRTGKSLRRQVTEVVVRWRDAPQLAVGGRRQRPIPTLLVIRIQPDEGITLRIGAKRPGPRFEMVPAGMKLEYRRLARAPLPDAYDNVLSEVLAGGHTVFPGGREIERSWEIVDPLVSAWEAEGHPETYERGSWGPGAADDLVIANGGIRWVNSGDEPGTA